MAKCPFLDKECIEKKCQLWHDTNCAIVEIAKNTEYLEDIMNAFEEKVVIPANEYQE